MGVALPHTGRTTTQHGTNPRARAKAREGERWMQRNGPA